jgi:hypothetical protein
LIGIVSTGLGTATGLGAGLKAAPILANQVRGKELLVIELAMSCLATLAALQAFQKAVIEAGDVIYPGWSHLAALGRVPLKNRTGKLMQYSYRNNISRGRV